MGATREQLETKLNRAAKSWTAHDVAQLEVVYTSIRRGEVTKDEEFPPPRLTSEDITNQPTAPDAGAGSQAAGEGAWPEVRRPGSGS